MILNFSNMERHENDRCFILELILKCMQVFSREYLLKYHFPSVTNIFPWYQLIPQLYPLHLLFRSIIFIIWDKKIRNHWKQVDYVIGNTSDINRPYASYRHSLFRRWQMIFPEDKNIRVKRLFSTWIVFYCCYNSSFSSLTSNKKFAFSITTSFLFAFGEKWTDISRQDSFPVGCIPPALWSPLGVSICGGRG